MGCYGQIKTKTKISWKYIRKLQKINTISKEKKIVILLRKTKKRTIRIWMWKKFLLQQIKQFWKYISYRKRQTAYNDFEIVDTFKKYCQNLILDIDLRVPNNLPCRIPKNGDEVLLQYLNVRIIQVSKSSILTFLSNGVIWWHRKGDEEFRQE